MLQLIKGSAKRILRNETVGGPLLNCLLKAHNFAYRQAGVLSELIEQGNIHPKHRLMKYHDWFLTQVKPEWSVLDVGCGNGALSKDLAQKCRKVTGIEISEKKIAKAKARCPQATFIHGDATQYPFREEFDAIVLSNVLEHIEDRVVFLSKLKRLSPVFLIRVPLINRDWITLYKKERGIEYRLDDTHFIEYTPEEFIQEVENVGLQVQSLTIQFGELYAVCAAK